jgi:hypothetical protein
MPSHTGSIGERGLNLKDVCISKDLGVGIFFLRSTYSVNFKLDCKPKELLQEIYSILDSLGSFLISPLH